MPGFFDSYLAGGQAARQQQDQQVARQQQAEQYGQGQEDRQAQSVANFGRMFLSLPADQKPAAYPQLAQMVNSMKMPHPPIPSEYRPDMDQNIERFMAALAGQRGQSDLPSDARSAIFFRDNPELLKQENERYKNRPTYDPSTGALIYPKGAPDAAPVAPPPPAAAPQFGSLVIDDEMLQNLLAVPASERPTMLAAFQADAKGQDFQMHPGADGQPVMSASPGFAAAPPKTAAGPGVVQVGPTANQKAYDTESGRNRAARDQAPFDVQLARDKAQAESDVKRGADLKEAMPKARLALSSAKIKAENVNRAIDSAIPLVGVWTAGTVGRPLSSLGGTAAANLRANIDTLEANLAFNELQSMRASSPTGGALGSITEKELELLGSTITSLKQSQSPEQLRQNLGFVKKQYAKVLAQMEADFKTDYAQMGATRGVAPAAAAANAPKRLKFNPKTMRIE